MNEPTSNQELIALIVKTGGQDKKAFTDLYTVTSPRLFAVLIRILKEENEASDVLQDVFVAVWNRAAQFDPDKGGAMPWLATIARNAGIDALRRRRPGHIGEEFCDERQSEEPSPFDHLQSQLAARDLRSHVKNLPDMQRCAVLMFYIEEQSLAQIAIGMNAPLNTVKSWVRRGVSNLRKEFYNRSLRDFI